MMEYFEYHSLLKQLNEEHTLILMKLYIKKIIISQHTDLFIFDKGVGTNKFFILNFIIQGFL
jgi:hypothetical protein